MTEKGHPAKYLAMAGDIEQSTVSAILNKDNFSPRPETLRKLAAAMLVSRGKVFALAYGLEEEDLIVGGGMILEGDEEELVHHYRALPHRYQRTALRVILGLLDSEDNLDEQHGEGTQSLRLRAGRG